MEKKINEISVKLAECIAACNYCFNACLDEQDVKMMAGCIRLDKQCAEICALTLSSVASKGELTKEILELCAEACDKCAKECGKHNYDHCKKCAEACRQCAEACRTFHS